MIAGLGVCRMLSMLRNVFLSPRRPKKGRLRLEAAPTRQLSVSAKPVTTWSWSCQELRKMQEALEEAPKIQTMETNREVL